MSDRKGFTLIELLVVVVIIGILAAIAIPKFANTKQKAVKSAMISDLRNLATAQEAFFADSTKYATTYGTTIGTGQVSFAVSQNNVVAISSSSNASGWAATITNPGYNTGSSHCGVYIGAAFSGSQTGASAEGVPGCQ
jgi:type IV pilus assembly protein PilA